jgi:hypothetical protein
MLPASSASGLRLYLAEPDSFCPAPYGTQMTAAFCLASLDNFFPYPHVGGNAPTHDKLACVRPDNPSGNSSWRSCGWVGVTFYRLNHISIFDEPYACLLVCICAPRMNKYQVIGESAIRYDYVCQTHIVKLTRPSSRQTLAKVAVKFRNLYVLPVQQQTRHNNNN